MPKQLLFIVFSLLFFHAPAQDTTLTPRQMAMLDSMFQNDAFFKMLGKSKPSYVVISMGVGNGIFSLKNNSLNAGQAETKKGYYTGSAGYYHKSGFGLGVDGFFANDNGRFIIYQYGINPSYNYLNKKISAGISYTRFVNATNASFEVNPYKNDLYGNIQWKKPWWRPGIALGFASGKYEEVYDSVITYNIPGPIPPMTVHITDTITTKLRNVSLTLSTSHEWKFEKIFKKDDDFRLEPSLLLNFSNQYINITHSNSLNNRRPIVQKLLKAAYGDGTASEPFQLQSAAFLINASYYIGRFNFAPQVYFDYYFPQTPGNPFSVIYSIMAGYAF